jgi:dihydropteroate synthase
VARTPAAVAAAAAADDVLSNRRLELDPAGYFLIAARHSVEDGGGYIIAQHYENTINDAGLACDPRTGVVIPCAGYSPPPPREFTGATAKQVCVAILESEAGAGCVSRLEHAAYLGRELQKAEHALVNGLPYVQD